MANEEHLEILGFGPEAWNQWREEYPDTRPDLSKADLNELDLRGANLQGVNLYDAKLIGSNLAGANLSEANLFWTEFYRANLAGANIARVDLFQAYLRDADFTSANFDRADLTGAILSDAILHAADLSRVNFNGTNLEGTDFSGAVVGWATFADVDLSVAIGLDNVFHNGPSTIGVDTIHRSQGSIPEIFLRGAGVPDALIEYSASLTGQPIEYHSCFISHSSTDGAFARQLHSDLQEAGVRCWFAPEDMKIGDRIRPTLDRSVRMHDKLLIILSENSVASDWVEKEVETALARERQENRTVLFPIRLDDTVMEIDAGWPALVRNTRHIGDFRNWKDRDAYQRAFGRLLRDLKAGTSEGKD